MTQPLFAGGPTAAEDVFLQELPASLRASLSASAALAEDTNPTNLIFQGLSMRNARRDDRFPTLPAEEARKRIRDARLDLTVPDEGINERALEIMMDGKYQEKVWQDTLARGPQGIAAGAAKLGTGLMVSLFDPLNIASAFIPVVGQARYAAMLERAGAAFASRAAVRAQVGAVEGLAGAALLEPLVYGIATDLQKDYTLADSFLNVAFGTILGGGLHVGGGAVRDHISGGGDIRTTPPKPGIGETVARMTPEQRMETFKVALAQAVDGRAVDVEAVVRQADEFTGGEAVFRGVKTADQASSKGVVFTTPDRSMAEGYAGPGGQVRELEVAANARTLDLTALPSVAKEDDVFSVLRDALGESTAAKLLESNSVRTNSAGDMDTYTLLRGAENVAILREAGFDAIKFRQLSGGRELVTVAVVQPTKVRPKAQQAGQGGAAQVAEAVTRTASPEARVAPLDAKAATEMTARVQAAEATERAIQVEPEKAIEAERAELMAEMQDLKAMESALELEPGKFEAEDKLIADAETLAKAADAMARCQLRN
jgi:hypothetical protein